MIADAGDQGAFQPLPSPRMRSVVALLWQARCYAEDVQAAPWDFALESRFLTDSLDDVRWLVMNQLCDAAHETSAAGSPHRSFQQVIGLEFDHRTCFVLTDRGARFAVEILRSRQGPGLPLE